jgi:hypothetical protein
MDSLPPGDRTHGSRKRRGLKELVNPRIGKKEEVTAKRRISNSRDVGRAMLSATTTIRLPIARVFSQASDLFRQAIPV